jgi:hypothetical protein
VLIVEVEGKSGLPAMFGDGLRLRGPTSNQASGPLPHPGTALVEYLETHGMKRI